MAGNIVRAAMTGKIVQIAVKPEEVVKKGDVLLIMESMKMETKILSPKDGVIAEVFAKSGLVMDEGAPLIAYVAVAEPPKKK